MKFENLIDIPYSLREITIYCIPSCKVGDRSWRRPEGSLFNSYYNEVQGRALLLSLNCSTLPLICTLYCWELSKEASRTIFKVFGMTWPGIEPRSTRPLANTLPTRPMSQLQNYKSTGRACSLHGWVTAKKQQLLLSICILDKVRLNNLRHE